MSDILSIEEINEKYPDEWVVVDEPITTESYEIVRGTVIAHDPDRDEIHRQIMDIRPKNFAVFYTGDLTPGEAYAL